MKVERKHCAFRYQAVVLSFAISYCIYVTTVLSVARCDYTRIGKCFECDKHVQGELEDNEQDSANEGQRCEDASARG